MSDERKVDLRGKGGGIGRRGGRGYVWIGKEMIWGWGKEGEYGGWEWRTLPGVGAGSKDRMRDGVDG